MKKIDTLQIILTKSVHYLSTTYFSSGNIYQFLAVGLVISCAQSANIL